ncbi:hypothetical protein D3C87_2187830 [compost metagenome]
MSASLVIITDLDLIGVAIPPNETNTPLIVDPDAVLSLAIALQGLQAIPRRNEQSIE